MKYIGSKEENIEYRKRPGAYAIIINKNDDKVGIVTDGEDYFYLGGGIEQYVSKMFREWQRYIMERFIEERSGR